RRRNASPPRCPPGVQQLDSLINCCTLIRRPEINQPHSIPAFPSRPKITPRSGPAPLMLALPWSAAGGPACCRCALPRCRVRGGLTQPHARKAVLPQEALEDVPQPARWRRLALLRGQGAQHQLDIAQAAVVAHTTPASSSRSRLCAL